MLDVRERNSMAFTLDIRTKSHTVRGILGSVRELYERSTYERSLTSESSIEKYRAKHVNTNYRVFRQDREPSRLPRLESRIREPTLKRLRSKTRKLKEFDYERIRPSIPKSS